MYVVERDGAIMDTPIEYRPIKQGDATQIFDFITEVFNQFVAPEFSQEGIAEFLEYIQPNTLAGYLESNHFGFMAYVGPEIAGVIVVRDDNHVALFFVASQYQRKGVGRTLFRMVLSHCRSRDVTTTGITVNASPNSVNAYKKLNFEPTDIEQCVNGIRFVPMVLRLP